MAEIKDYLKQLENQKTIWNRLYYPTSAVEMAKAVQGIGKKVNASANVSASVLEAIKSAQETWDKVNYSTSAVEMAKAVQGIGEKVNASANVSASVLEAIKSAQETWGKVNYSTTAVEMAKAVQGIGRINTRELVESLTTTQQVMERQIISPMVKSFNEKASTFSYGAGLVVLDEFFEGLEKDINSEALTFEDDSGQEIITTLIEIIRACLEQIEVLGHVLNTLQTNQTVTSIIGLLSIASSIITIVVFLQKKPTEIHHHHYHQLEKDEDVEE